MAVSAGSSQADVTAVKGSACGYYVNVGLFGGPQMLRGCGQPGDAPANGSSPSVTLPAEGSATPITAEDPDGATAQYGPARIFSGRWPEHVSSAPPSGPISVSTQGTTGPGGSVTSKVDIVLRTPANADSPGGFGPGPVEGDELHVECSAMETGVTGSTRFVNGVLWLTTDSGGSPLATEPIPDNPPPNYTRHGVLTNVGDVFSVVFNEQIVNADGSLTVNAFHMYLFGPVAVGESVGGQVTCGTTPTTVSPNDTVAPTCGVKVVAPVAPDDPTPKSPREELIGVFDAGGLQSITNVQVTNGTVRVPPDGPGYLEFEPGKTGPLPIVATRTTEAEAANLPMTWTFDATDVAGNVTHCDGTGNTGTPTTTTTTPGATTTTVGGGGTTTTVGGGATTTTVGGATTTRPPGTTTTTRPGTTTSVPTGTPTSIPTSLATTATTSAPQQLSVLARTGALLKPLALVSAIGLVLGALFLLRRNPEPVGAEAGYRLPPVAAPEKWGPAEIARALKGAIVALALGVVRRFSDRSGPPRPRG